MFALCKVLRAEQMLTIELLLSLNVLVIVGSKDLRLFSAERITAFSDVGDSFFGLPKCGLFSMLTVLLPLNDTLF